MIVRNAKELSSVLKKDTFSSEDYARIWTVDTHSNRLVQIRESVNGLTGWKRDWSHYCCGVNGREEFSQQVIDFVNSDKIDWKSGEWLLLTHWDAPYKDFAYAIIPHSVVFPK